MEAFFVIDRKDYDLVNDQNTYKKVTKSPFQKIECELNSQQLELHGEQKLQSTGGVPPAIRGSVFQNHIWFW